MLCASVNRARAAVSCARADCRPLSSFCASSRAITWPGRTVSPMFALRSSSRPSMRNDLLISVCAWTVPVSAMVSPAAPLAIVSTRTGRISGAGGSVARLHDDSSASAATATTATDRREQPVRQGGVFQKHEATPCRRTAIFGDPASARNGTKHACATPETPRPGCRRVITRLPPRRCSRRKTCPAARGIAPVHAFVLICPRSSTGRSRCN